MRMRWWLSSTRSCRLASTVSKMSGVPQSTAEYRCLIAGVIIVNTKCHHKRALDAACTLKMQRPQVRPSVPCDRPRSKSPMACELLAVPPCMHQLPLVRSL
jgi:hypothetical protein